MDNAEHVAKYFVFPKGKPEDKFEVLPYESGDIVQNDNGKYEFAFADAKLAGTEGWNKPETLYVWDNDNRDGWFVNNDVEQLDVTGTYDIAKE